MTSEKYLIAALEEMGFAGKLEVFQVPTQLYGYQGDKRSQKAHIIIRRQHVGSASNDIGFERLADGTFKIYISDYDKTRYNAKWIEKLKTTYSYLKINDTAKKRGYTTSMEKKGDKVVLTLSRWG
jgi:hypothetical protein